MRTVYRAKFSHPASYDGYGNLEPEPDEYGPERDTRAQALRDKPDSEYSWHSGIQTRQTTDWQDE